MPTFKPDKLKTNLRLSINRFKLLEKKKSESPQFTSPFTVYLRANS